MGLVFALTMISPVQARIAAVHARASTPAETQWKEIAALYDLLLEMAPSPVIELNRAAAIAMAEGPAVGLAMIETMAIYCLVIALLVLFANPFVG